MFGWLRTHVSLHALQWAVKHLVVCGGVEDRVAGIAWSAIRSIAIVQHKVAVLEGHASCELPA